MHPTGLDGVVKTDNTKKDAGKELNNVRDVSTIILFNRPIDILLLHKNSFIKIDQHSF